MYDLMIIGGGPAGLSASVYAARKRLNVLLVSTNIGGQMNWALRIENYMGYQFIEAAELISKFQAQVDQFPIGQKIGEAVSRLEKIEGGFAATTEVGDRYQARAVILATGKRPKRLNVPGEAEFSGRGVTYCAVCDGPLFAGKRVAVVGGGNSALEAALDMVNIAEHIYLISHSSLTGDQVLIDRLGKAKNVAIFTEYQTEKIEGGQFVQGMVIKKRKNGESKRLEVSGVFIEIGLVPSSDPVSGLVKLNELGEVTISCNCETTVPGLYAAGDVTNVPEKQVLVAAGEGAKAALQAHRYLKRLPV